MFKKFTLALGLCLLNMQLSAVPDLADIKLTTSQVHQKKSKEENYKLHRFLLITGCARSGTTYISELLEYCGLDVKHELIGSDGCSSWFMCVDADKVPWENRPSAKYISFDHIFHQVRNPLDVISSVYATEPLKAINYFCENIPEINSNDKKLVKCAKYWYYWNLYAEKKAEWRYQIEQIDAVLDEMGLRLGVALDKSVLEKISRQSNHRNRQIKFTWSDLRASLPPDLFQKIQEMAVRYGYPIND